MSKSSEGIASLIVALGEKKKPAAKQDDGSGRLADLLEEYETAKDRKDKARALRAFVRLCKE